MSRPSAGVGGSLSTRTTSASTAWASDSDSSASDSAGEESYPPPARKSSPHPSRAGRRSRLYPARSEPLPATVRARCSTAAPVQTFSSRSLPCHVPDALARHAAAQGRPFSTYRDKASRTSVVAAHLRHHWPAYAALVVGCASLSGWYLAPPGSGGGTSSRSLSTATPPQFAVRRSSSDGGGYKIVTALAATEVDRVLRSHERSTRVDRPPSACRVARFDTNSVASNAPCEDKRAEVIVERDWPAPSTASPGAAKGDLCFFAIMDGHAGSATSSLLAQKLIPFVALELDKLFRQQAEYAPLAAARAGPAALVGQDSRTWKSALSLGGLLGGKSATPPGSAVGRTYPHIALDADPELVETALKRAFAGLDQEICSTPVKHLHEYELMHAALPNMEGSHGRVVSVSSSSPQPEAASVSRFASLFARESPSPGPTLAERQQAAYDALRPAMNGSCALLTYIDSARGDVYVACTGDSRAIGGYWNPSSQTWSFEPLSTDQTGRNPSEVARMRAEHPPQEADQVIMRGRVLGGLEPTRAFGDAVYKWDRSLQERLYDAFVPGGVAGARRIPRLLRTPPYVTSEPLVQVQHLPPLSTSPEQAGDKQLRFIVMATDGLWDMLANDEVGALIAGHLAGLKGDVKANSLMANVLKGPDHGLGISSPSAQDGDKNPLSPPSKAEQSFTFLDDNLSTHLIRNALGGAHRDRVAGLLAIPSPESRRYRDDITVNVILLHDHAQERAKL